jgi:hypothetical protein
MRRRIHVSYEEEDTCVPSRRYLPVFSRALPRENILQVP